MQSLVRSISDRFPLSRSGTSNSKSPAGADSTAFSTAKTQSALFPPTDPAIDGEDCLHDCASCSTKLPRKWSIDNDQKLYGHVDEWKTHLLVATGKTDWVRDVTDEKGSVMEAIGKADAPSNGKMMLSASNMPLPENAESHADGTTVLLLPAFAFIDNVTPDSIPNLLKESISAAPTNTTPLQPDARPSLATLETRLPPALKLRPCTHKYLILLCSQATRDARCGQSAPLIRKELERHLRPLGLQRDLDDTRPGGAAIYFISHVGGHKFSANVMIYRRAGEGGEASQCIWLARVRPEDCENIVRYTLLQGKIVKPGSQLRGGFDRQKQLVSW